MSDHDGIPDDMNERNLTDGDIERLIKGEDISHPDGQMLADLIADLRTTGVSPAPDEIASRHIAAAAIAAADATPAPGSTPPARAPLLHRMRRRTVLSSLLSTVVAKVFAGSVALATVTGGLAASGTLPDVVQDPIAGVYNTVGFDFPTSDDAPEVELEDEIPEDEAVENEAPENETPEDEAVETEHGIENEDEGVETEHGIENEDEGVETEH
ncbi:MAG: hypothetical protein ACE5GC_07600, partial [Acidimicrobiia bacterium]